MMSKKLLFLFTMGFLASIAVLFAGSAPASAAQVTWDFEDGTDQGFGDGFGPDASHDFPIVNIGGSNRMEVLRDGGFQEAGREITGDPALAAINAAARHPDQWVIKYDWYVDTSLGAYGTFLQLGTYFNSGSGAYTQKEKDVELDGVALASGSVFSGTVAQTLTGHYGAINPGHLQQSFQRLGLIVNGDGADATVYYDNIMICSVPEPASLALFGLALPAIALVARRRR